MHWIAAFQFLPIYALVVISLGLCMYLFFSTKREIRRVQLRMKQQNVLLQEAYDRMEFAIEQLKGQFHELEGKAGELVPPSPAKSGMNLNKRTQAARMFRRGERPEQIAAALSLPQNEVALLLRVHQASMAS
jgi:hypothetical protein